MLACLNVMPGRMSGMQPGQALVTGRYRVLAPAAVIPGPPQMMELHEPVVAPLGRMPCRSAPMLSGRWRGVDPRGAVHGGEEQPSDCAPQTETTNKIHF